MLLRHRKVNQRWGYRWGYCRVPLATGVLALGFTLAACGAAQPRPEQNELAVGQVRILVDPGSPQELVLGEIYKQTLARSGRESRLVPLANRSADTRLEALFSGDADFIIGCTGNLLASIDPARAAMLATEFADAGDTTPNSSAPHRDQLAETHIAVMGSLPLKLTAVEPSTAEGCQEDRSSVDLPQNVMVIYSKGLLDRGARQAVTAVSKFLTDKDLAELTVQAKASGTPAHAVANWLKTSSTTTD